VNGLNYFHTKKFGIYFVATTKYNVSPSFVMDIIYRMMKVFRDYCGVLSEESIRKNFVLIYEIIDEVIDYGHP
jgi:AP-4 complex subunit mu-1